MRLHHLRATAFGPFADTVTVDFDRLSDAGLFLLSGPTGAGKTSVLDAVCFALYGDVPGDRAAAKRLRCDQAAPGVAPRVELELTLSGRRFRIMRSPAWERPKKRGTGTTTEPASVVIAERVAGSWVTHSTRLDETGHLITRLVGMNLGQFTQVALLPQGQFQAFLRARSEDRHQLLQQLFRTGRFHQVERWLREHRLSLRRTSEAAHERVAALVSRVSEVVDAPPPEGWDLHDLAGPAADGSLAAWVDAHLTQAGEAAAAGQTALVAAGRVEVTARRALEQGRSLAERRDRVRAALAERKALRACADDVDRTRAAVDAARRAAAVLPVHRLAVAAAGARDRAEESAGRATAEAADRLDLLFVDRPSLESAVTAAQDAAAAVRAALPREAALERLEAELAEGRTRAAELARLLATTEQELAVLPERLDLERLALEEARTATVGLAGAEGRVAELDERIVACRTATALEQQLADARTELQAATADALARWEQLLDVRQARLEGMAAEIAGGLVVGACCPVCGSADHPHKAEPIPGAPDAAAEKAALKASDDAKATQLLHDELVRDLVTRLAVARAAAGEAGLDHLQAARSEAAQELRRLQDLAATVAVRAQAVADTEADTDRLAADQARRQLDAGRLDAHLERVGAEAAALRAELADLLAGTGSTDLQHLLGQHLGRVTAGRRACEALDQLAAATAALAEAEAALAEAVDEASFDGPEDALAAALDPARIDELTRAVHHHTQRQAAVSAILDEPGTAALLATEAPDPTRLADEHDAALAALGEARAAAERWARREQRLGELVSQLADALDAWTPLRAELALATEVSSFVEGKAADNRLQMRLSAFVLAYRLSQVVAAANERLARMSDRRYSLEHTGRRGAGETRGGLSLLVRDDWSGEARDPATLSGGETFVVSLALALGLADVVTQEAGGPGLDTLFVDEGFGSLDADTLDDVLDTLDALRDGGRVVGVVSHVAEMRDRIPVQLVVSKSRRGSTLSLTG